MQFSSGASAFTWGENFSAQVRPQEEGALLEISGVGKVGGQSQQSARTNKLINQIFSEVIAILKSSAPPGSSPTSRIAGGIAGGFIGATLGGITRAQQEAMQNLQEIAASENEEDNSGGSDFDGGGFDF